MAIDEQTPAGQWAELWAVYMRENRALTARAEAAEQRAEALAAEVAQARAEGLTSGIHAAAEVLARRADAMSASGHHGYAYEVREVRLVVLEVLAEAQPAGEVSDG